MKIPVTYGSQGGNDPVARLGRIYDRLRKRAWRASWLNGGEAYLMLVDRGGELQPWLNTFSVIDLADAYLAGVLDALNAVVDEVVCR